MRNFAQQAWKIFEESIHLYHQLDDIDQPMPEKYPAPGLEYLLFKKNWIDTVQWHLEDIIRDEGISPENALLIKRRIDKSNQERTDLVEEIDAWFWNEFSEITPTHNARLNTETPAWAVDRLSILALKIFHMKIEAERLEADAYHREKCSTKLSVLLQQKQDLMLAIEELLQEIADGKVKMRLYKQMKMYNDESLNPVLYQKKKNG